MRRWMIVALALLPAGCGPVTNFTSNPDGPHTLAMYEHKEGDVYRVTSTKSGESDAAATSDHRGKTDKAVVKEKKVYTEEVLEKPAEAKWATRLRRTYEVVEKSHSGQEVKSHLVGKTVEVEWTGDTPKFMVEGKPPTTEQTKELEGDFGKTRSKSLTNAEMLPGKPVKVGDTWTVEREKVTAGLPEIPGMKLDGVHGMVSGKLVKVTQLGDKRQATVEFTIRMPVLEMGPPGQKVLKADDDSRMVLTSTVEFCLDGSAPGEWTVYDGRARVGTNLPSNGLFTMHYNESGTVREETVAKK